MDWMPYTIRLADEVASIASGWSTAVMATPRHLLVPRWWDYDPAGWRLRDGPADEAAWLEAAYSDQTLVTRIGPLHADHARPDDRPTGRATSSATMPGLVVRMLGHAEIEKGDVVLDVGTGPGYSAALLAWRQGSHRVVSIDVDPYVTKAAAERLETLEMSPRVVTCDATGPLPDGTYDRIVATVAVRPIPASWLAALRPGGRLVTTIAGTCIIITVDATPDGGAVGRVEWDRAGFMRTRADADYPPALSEFLAQVRDRDGDEITRGRYPVLEVEEAWEVASMLELAVPGIEHHYQEDADGRRTAWMLHPDGSWSRASAVGDEPPIVHQGGPRRLWEALERIRHRQLVTGQLPLYGADVRIDPDGTCHLTRGRWQATISATSG